MSDASLSVVCSTYNRSGRVQSLLRALEAQTLDQARFEVVIVNNGSSDDTAAVLAEFSSNTNLNFRCVTLEQNRGASGGRNAGWRAANAPIVAFTDDDCVPDPGWLAAGLAAVEATGAAIVVGETRPNPAQRGNEGPWSRTQTVNSRLGTTYFNTCNIFYRRDDLAAVGGFDEEFRTKGGEDTDLGWCVEEQGGTAAFAADALVLHDISRGSFRAALREASSWLDIPRVTKKHRARARPMLVHRVFWKESHEYVLLALVSVSGSVVLRNVLPLLGVFPWLNWRARRNPFTKRVSKAQRLMLLPHVFVLDAVELSAMVRGSMRHRTVVL